MRIAIPLTNGKLDEHFGQCESFAFIDTDEDRTAIRELHTVSAPAPEGRVRALSNPACFVCGSANPRGLRLHFQPSEGNGVEAQWAPSPEWEGFRGIVHGGVVSTVLDEAMSKAVAGLGCEALTAELRVRFRRPVHSFEKLSIHGWVHRRTKRRIETEAALTGSDGLEFAHAWATFLELRSSAPETKGAEPMSR